MSPSAQPSLRPAAGPQDPASLPPAFAPATWLRRALGTLALLLAPGAEAAGAPRPPPLVEANLHIGMSQHAFSLINENDATAAMRVLSAELGKNYGYNLKFGVSLFADLPAFAQAIRAGQVTHVTINPWEFFAMGIEDAVDIRFSAVSNGAVTHRWLLLVRRDGGFTSVAALQGRRALVLQNESATLGLPWLETILLEQGLGSPAQFFGSCQTAGKASAAVLPVFFGKADACVVDQTAFEVLGEMNPQVGQRLTVLASRNPCCSASSA